MFRFLAALTLATATIASAATDYAEPPPTFDAAQYTSWQAETSGASRKAAIYVPFTSTNTAGETVEDFVSVTRLSLVGDSSKERGYAHGFLMRNEIIEFSGPKLDKYFMDLVLDLDISQFPEPVQSILRVIQVKGALAAPEAIRKALAWVWQKQEQYTPQYLIDEMDGIAEGLCAAAPAADCNVTQWAETIKEVNMLPELIRMACTAYGAWGPATPADTELVQVRALDFGTGPFANYTVIQVQHLSAAEQGQSFVAVSFPGFAGVITGVSQNGIGISEKVWMTYDTPDLQPGTYDGEADVMVLRDILQLTSSREEAEAYLQQARRTWAIWVGIGDFKTNVFDLVGYTEESALVYTDETMPSMTGMPYLESVCYVDKHPQPSHDGATGTLPTALTDFYGNITQETSKIITQYHGTGDLHIASYDFGANSMYVSVGRINSDGKYCPEDCPDSKEWNAHNRPYLRFSLSDLWEEV